MPKTKPEPTLLTPEPPDTLPATSLTPMDLLQQAVASDANIDNLERLMALQERWEDKQAERAYAEAMHACQMEMPTVVKDGRNAKTGSGYALKETVQRTVKPCYSKHGFSISFGEEPCPTAGFKRTIADVTHAAGHTRRYYLDLPIDGIGPQGNPIGGMNAVQGGVSTLSYGHRVLMAMVFNITIADTDLDGNTDLPTVTEDEAIQLREAAEGLPDMVISKGFEWVEMMTGAKVAGFAEVPQVAFRDFRAKLAEKRADAERGAT